MQRYAFFLKYLLLSIKKGWLQMFVSVANLLYLSYV